MDKFKEIIDDCTTAVEDNVILFDIFKLHKSAESKSLFIINP